LFHAVFHDNDAVSALESLCAAHISQCNKEICMGFFEIIAGAFIVSVPALVLADVLEPRATDAEK
jgi:hypothetical protein